MYSQSCPKFGDCLESVATQTLPQAVGWEILVVDNNSSDETHQAVKGFQQRYPGRIRYLFEPTQGLSYARNAGIRGARSDILAFIDDDETADPGWLQNLTQNLHRGEWAGAGGRVLAQWNGSRPRWASSDSSFALGPLAAFDPGLEAGQMTVPPVGANMAFKKQAFHKYGDFRTDLGRSGKNLLSNEDIEFGRRLLAAGEQLRYEPSAVTHHPVEETRARRDYFLKWWFNKGRSDVMEFGILPNRRRVLGVPFRLFRDAAVEAARWTVAVDPPQRFVSKLKVWCYAGQAFESYSQVHRNDRRRGASSDIKAA